MGKIKKYLVQDAKEFVKRRFRIKSV